jgi:hypothetical protein
LGSKCPPENQNQVELETKPKLSGINEKYKRNKTKIKWNKGRKV